MKIICGDYKNAVGQRIAEWYMEQSKWRFHTVYTATGFVDQFGDLRGAAIFTDYNGANIELHFIGKDVITKANIKCLVDYVFNQLNCIRCTTTLQRKDKKIAKILVRIGFEYECTLKSYYGLFPEQDALVFRMFKPQAEKWM